MARAARNSWNPFSVSYAMKKETGLSAAANFQQTMSQLQETWKSQAQSVSFSRPLIVNTAPKLSFTTYVQQVFEKDGSILAQKAGFDTTLCNSCASVRTERSRPYSASLPL
jgi:hypothetical protein